jgi:cation:H+ antiporter
MAAEFALAGLGLVILLLAGDVLVKGAVNLSLRLGIPALIVSLTIVAFGTSAPELLISIKSILDGVPGLALGNVVGSNTANILLVLGIPANHLGAACRQRYAPDLRRDDHRARVLFIALAFTGPFTWWHGLILLSLLAYVLFDAARSAQAHRAAANGADVDRRPGRGRSQTCRGGASASTSASV